MSDLSAGGISTDGRGSKEGGGGGDVVRPGQAGVGSGTVTNQPLLVLDSHIYEGLSDQQALRLKLIQLEFAQDVSSHAAAAYGRILDALRPSTDPK